MKKIHNMTVYEWRLKREKINIKKSINNKLIFSLVLTTALFCLYQSFTFKISEALFTSNKVIQHKFKMESSMLNTRMNWKALFWNLFLITIQDIFNSLQTGSAYVNTMVWRDSFQWPVKLLSTCLAIYCNYLRVTAPQM